MVGFVKLLVRGVNNSAYENRGADSVASAKQEFVSGASCCCRVGVGFILVAKASMLVRADRQPPKFSRMGMVGKGTPTVGGGAQA